jgi:hypothetical protein
MWRLGGVLGSSPQKLFKSLAVGRGIVPQSDARSAEKTHYPTRDIANYVFANAYEVLNVGALC